MSTDAILKPSVHLHIKKTQQNQINQRVSVLKDPVTADMKNWRFFMQFWRIKAHFKQIKSLILSIKHILKDRR